MSTYFKLSEDERKAIMEEMALNREMGIDPLSDEPPSAEIIWQEVARFYGSGDSFEQMQMAFYLVRKLTNLSLSEIGVLMHKDKDEVRNAIHSMDTLLKQGDPELEVAIRTILIQIMRHYAND